MNILKESALAGLVIFLLVAAYLEFRGPEAWSRDCRITFEDGETLKICSVCKGPALNRDYTLFDFFANKNAEEIEMKSMSEIVFQETTVSDRERGLACKDYVVADLTINRYGRAKEAVRFMKEGRKRIEK